MIPNQVISEVEYNVVGKRPVRPDGVDKVTGGASFATGLAAIANGIHKAAGVWMRSLPMTPGKLLEAGWEQTG